MALNTFSVSYGCLLKALAFVIHIVYVVMLVKYTTVESDCARRLPFSSLTVVQFEFLCLRA